jgi:hypothetical protein
MQRWSLTTGNIFMPAAPFLHPTHGCARRRDRQEPQQN